MDETVESSIQTVTSHRENIAQPGTIIGNYVILQDVIQGSKRNEYIVRVAPEEDENVSQTLPHEPHLRMIEGVSGTLASVQLLEQQQLRHPRLLAIRDFFTVDGFDYAVIDIPEMTWPIPTATNLSAEDVLKVGILISETLLYLHGLGVIHGQINPKNICITGSGVFLAGVENATILSEDPNPETHPFAPDVNALATLLLALLPTVESASHDAQVIVAVREISRKGSDNAYNSVHDLLADALKALPDGLPSLTVEASQGAMRAIVGRATTIGHVREQNQDSIGVMSLDVVDDQPESSPGGIFLIADGMGGEAQGEVASRIAVRVIVAEVARRFLAPAVRSTANDISRSEISTDEPITVMHLESISSLVEAFRAANARIRNMARRLDRASGTTATALMLFGREAIIGHVGDSRAYIYRRGELIQLTQDHSLVQKLIEMGQYNPETSEFPVPRNYLYRSLGQSDDMDVDTRVLKVGIGDIFMICSDGLWDLVPDVAIHEVLASEHMHPEAMATALVNQANEAGGLDNSTVLVIQLAEQRAV